jgi:hypothetical protein
MPLPDYEPATFASDPNLEAEYAEYRAMQAAEEEEAWRAAWVAEQAENALEEDGHCGFALERAASGNVTEVTHEVQA